MTRILIVDDEANSLRALARYLEAQGHRVEACATTAEAKAVARRFHPRVLLTDIVLREERTGVDLARELTAEDPDLRVVVMSGLPEPEVRERTATIHVGNVFLKPLNLGQLSAALANGSE
jgi:two-component system response regulator RegA